MYGQTEAELQLQHKYELLRRKKQGHVRNYASYMRQGALLLCCLCPHILTPIFRNLQAGKPAAAGKPSTASPVVMKPDKGVYMFF
jgi:hypothetical protein